MGVLGEPPISLSCVNSSLSLLESTPILGLSGTPEVSLILENSSLPSHLPVPSLRGQQVPLHPSFAP